MVDSFSPVTGFQHFQFGTSMPIKGRRSPSHCYSSLESVIEQSKEGYYLALRRTQGTIGTEAPDWTPEALQEFLANPKGVVKGTKMSFAGLKKPEDRADLIAYLQTMAH
jgi:hypothetical protein